MFANVASKLQALGSFLRLRRKWIGIFLLVLFVGGVAVSIFAPPALAQTAGAAGIISVDFWLGLFATVILAIAGLFIKLTIFILTFIITLAGYNGYLDSTAVNVGWVMVRDFTNMGFVVILLVIAFGTILGSESYEWKKLLGKFVFTAIIVNFSRTICGVIIDLAQIVMTTFVNGIAATAGGNLINAFQLNKILELADGVTPDKFTASAQFIAAVGGITFAAMVMGVMLTFLYMLIQRMVVLWVLIVLSPLAFVLSILPATQSFSSKWWSQFTSNVITGPVLLFFIWLSFVTLGSGDISSDIANHSTAPNRIDQDVTAGSGVAGAAQSAGISFIMTWSKMASFAIAIGMLMVGAKAASELGGYGADAVSGGLDFGKKVFGYASGLNAAKWTGSNVVAPAAKWAAMNAPLVGGNNWVNLGKSIKGAAGVVMGKLDEERNKKAASLEKDYGIFGKLGAMMIETGGRKAKRAEDWEKAAENQHKVVEESYSTSKSWGGMAKLSTGIDAHLAEELSHEKKELKYAEGRKAKLQNDHEVLAKTGKHTSYGEREHAVFETEAKYAILREEEELLKRNSVAEAQASEYENKGEFLRAEAIRKAAGVETLKKNSELYHNLNHDERMAQEEILMSKIADIKPEEGKTPEAKKLLEAQRKKLQQQKIALTIENVKDSAEASRSGRLASLKKTDFLDEEHGVDEKNRLRAELTRQLGEYVREGEEPAAIQKWNDSFRDEDSKQAALRALNQAYKDAAGQGDFAGIDLIDNKIVKGKLVLNWKTKAPDDAGSAAYWASHASKVDKVASMGNMDADGHLNGFGQRGQIAISEFYRGKDSRSVSSMDKAVYSDWNSAKVTPANADGYMEALKAMEGTMKEDGFKAHLELTQSLLARLKAVGVKETAILNKFERIAREKPSRPTKK